MLRHDYRPRPSATLRSAIIVACTPAGVVEYYTGVRIRGAETYLRLTSEQCQREGAWLMPVFGVPCESCEYMYKTG